MTLLAQGPNVGFMIPIPQYPLYSAQCDVLHGKFVGYYLNEEMGWQVTKADLLKSYDEAKAKGVDIRSITIINPGNPTGQIIGRESIEEVIRFAHEKKLVIIADEVYQENIYAEGKKFVSFKEVLRSLPAPICDDVELASFHSCSKVFFSEIKKLGIFGRMWDTRWLYGVS